MDPRFFRKYADLVESAETDVSEASFNAISKKLSKGMNVTDDLSKHLEEDEGGNPVASAITRRIMYSHPELLKHGPQAVMDAIDYVADFVGNVDEIGSSDVSAWVRHVEEVLNRG